MSQTSLSGAQGRRESVAPGRRDTRLEQIRRRDPGAEGRFWYSVVTTGVYCRPTCPSRRARPEHVRIHATLAEARATGFRPCRRCRPEEPSLQDRQRLLIERACAMLADPAVEPTGAAVAAAVGLSPAQFYRVFRRITGQTPAAYRRRLRSTSASRPLEPGVTVGETAKGAGEG